MKKTTIKIALLVVAILMAFGGIMVYYKTIVSPPDNCEFENQFYESDKIDIDNIQYAETYFNIDTTYFAIIHRIDFQYSSGLLTDSERDKLMKDFSEKYVRKFCDICNDKFNKSVWNETELLNMKNRISELRKLSKTDGQAIIVSNGSLDKVNNVIDNYYKAKAIASVSGYKGIQVAKQIIEKAKIYVSMSPINNCTELVSRLNSVSTRLEQAHYSYLVGQVEKLRPYYNYSQAEYDNLALFISNKFEEYKNNAEKTYGRISDISALENRAGRYYSNATFND